MVNAIYGADGVETFVDQLDSINDNILWKLKVHYVCDCYNLALTTVECC